MMNGYKTNINSNGKGGISMENHFTFGTDLNKLEHSFQKVFESNEQVANLLKPQENEQPLTSNLPPEKQKAITELKNKIDISNAAGVLSYGIGEQNRLSKFANQTLATAKSNNLGEAGELLTEIASQLDGFVIDPKENFFVKLFKKNANKVKELQIRYETVEQNVQRVLDKVEFHQITLQQDIYSIEKMEEFNLDYFQNLTVYIEAGRAKIAEINATELPKLQAYVRANPTDQLAANQLSELSNQINNFEKKLADLDSSKSMSQLMAVQLRGIKNSNQAMVLKLQSTKTLVMPMWKMNLAAAIYGENTNAAIRTQHAIEDTTHKLFTSTAELLKTNAIEAQKASERSAFSLETIRKVNEVTIDALKQVHEIQTTGAQQRLEAQHELQKMRDELVLTIAETTQGVNVINKEM